MKRFIYILIAIIILGGVGYYIFKQQDKPTEVPVVTNQNGQEQQANQSGNNNQQPTSTAPQAVTSQPQNSQQNNQVPSRSTYSSGQEGDMAPDILVIQVNYDGTKFNPAAVNIKVGDIVVFKNAGKSNFWPIANPSADYPEFNAKKAIAPGGKYQFQFLKAGSWNYFDHLNNSATGIVSVSK